MELRTVWQARWVGAASQEPGRAGRGRLEGTKEEKGLAPAVQQRRVCVGA